MSDYIKREDAIQIASHECQELRGIFGRIEDAILALPSADVIERKRGEWFHYEGMLCCSKCSAEFYDDIMEYCGDEVPRFCPDCGADMRGE